MFRFSRFNTSRNLIPVMPSNNTLIGMVSSTDIDKLVVQSSGRHGLLVNTSDSTSAISGKIAGIVAAVPSPSTAGSTVPFYVRPIMRNDIIEADYASTISTEADKPTTGAHAIVHTSNIGYF